MSTKTPEQSREYNARYRAKIKARAAQDGITQAQARVILSAEFQAAEAARLAAKPVKLTKPRLTEEERKQARREASARINAKRKAEREELGLTVAQYTAHKAGKPLDTIRAEEDERLAQRAARARKPSMPNTRRLTDEQRKQNNKESMARSHAKRRAEREELGLSSAEYDQYKKGKSLDEIEAVAEIKAQRRYTPRTTDDTDDDGLTLPESARLAELMMEILARNVLALAHTREPRAQSMLRLAQALIDQGTAEDNADLHQAGLRLSLYRSPEEKRTRWQHDDE
jgi:hypothetical protein